MSGFGKPSLLLSRRTSRGGTVASHFWLRLPVSSQAVRRNTRPAALTFSEALQFRDRRLGRLCWPPAHAEQREQVVETDPSTVEKRRVVRFDCANSLAPGNIDSESSENERAGSLAVAIPVVWIPSLLL